MFCRSILREAFLAEDVLGDGGEFFANGTAYELLLDISCRTFTGMNVGSLEWYWSDARGRRTGHIEGLTEE
jgi:hypothetical protein